MVTAELAVALPAVLLVLALALAGLALGVDQVRCEDAARVAARAASRGEPVEVVTKLVRARVPEGSRVQVAALEDGVRVEVVAPARDRFLPGLPAARADAWALWEPGAEP